MCKPLSSHAKLVKNNFTFPLARDTMQATSQTHCKGMSVADLWVAYHTLKLAMESQKYYGKVLFYWSLTYLYLKLDMDLSVSPAIWQQFIDKVLKNMPNGERYKIIMDDPIIFSKYQKYFK